MRFGAISGCWRAATSRVVKPKRLPSAAALRIARQKRLYREAVRAANAPYQDDSEDYV